MRGFSYLWVLILTLALLTVLGSMATVTLRATQSVGLDRQRLQSWCYAESGITYYQNIHPALPSVVQLSRGRFEITQKQGIIYSTGYCGNAVQTITLKGSTRQLWFKD
jgi:hypothetical protein